MMFNDHEREFSDKANSTEQMYLVSKAEWLL